MHGSLHPVGAGSLSEVLLPHHLRIRKPRAPTAAGKFNKALKEIQCAKELSFGDLKIDASSSWIYYFAGKYPQAIKQCRQTLDMGPWFILSHVFLGHALIQIGRLSEAIAEFRWIVENFVEISVVLGVLGCTRAAQGNRKEAQRRIRRLHELSKFHYFSPYNEALIHAGLGQPEKAFRLLERVLVERSSWLIYLDVEPMFACLQSDKRFRRLVNHVDFKIKAELTFKCSLTAYG